MVQGVVPYVMDAKCPLRENVVEAMAHWERFTGIRFVKRTNEADYVRMFQGNGCYSYVGRIGGKQDLALCGCGVGGMLHEIGHAVGLDHEQHHPERDKNIRIHPENLSNVNARARASFKSVGRHDVHSVMHYDSFALSKNGLPTMTLLDGRIFRADWRALSPKDIAGVAALYGVENVPPGRGK